eukprot:8661425-Pyramimonas_sp.AAC.1
MTTTRRGRRARGWMRTELPPALRCSASGAGTAPVGAPRLGRATGLSSSLPRPTLLADGSERANSIYRGRGECAWQRRILDGAGTALRNRVVHASRPTAVDSAPSRA